MTNTSIDPDVTTPLFVVSGAQGSGKTTMYNHLVDELSGSAIVFDTDVLADTLNTRTAFHPITSDTVRDVWLHIAYAVGRNGFPTVVLSPYTPRELDQIRDRSRVGDVHFIVLDASDEERLARLKADPPARPRAMNDELKLAQQLRTELAENLVNTDDLDPQQSAKAVADLIKGKLAS